MRFREWESRTHVVARQPARAASLDVVLLGATGFTGALTAEYLAEHAPAGLRWALAGRNRAKLEAVRDRLGELDPALADLELIEADSSRPRLARRDGRAAPRS